MFFILSNILVSTHVFTKLTNTYAIKIYSNEKYQNRTRHVTFNSVPIIGILSGSAYTSVLIRIPPSRLKIISLMGLVGFDLLYTCYLID